jgi:hypothetical protein
MAVRGRTQAGQNFAPVGSGAPQAEQWMFMEPHFGGGRVIVYHRSDRRTSNLRSRRLVPMEGAVCGMSGVLGMAYPA